MIFRLTILSFVFRNLQKDFSSVNNKQTEESAIIIQKLWRGYKARQSMKDIAVKLQNQRTQDYIEYVPRLYIQIIIPNFNLTENSFIHLSTENSLMTWKQLKLH